jgi:aminoglycoside phosphotransferase (APT) family kinase protein
MSGPKMHDNEIAIDEPLVRGLLEAQFPHWAGLPLRRVQSDGTDNAMVRLGEDMVVRLPRIDWAVRNIDKECKWLPRLAPHLPLPVPVPLARGEPDALYPCPWSVCRWLDGETVQPDRIADPVRLATDLAHFVRALQRIDATGAPRAQRGIALAQCDPVMRRTLADSPGLFDTQAVARAWATALRAQPWTGPPVWFHGDLMAGNLLLRDDGVLGAVIDFGAMGAGDPACDGIAGWIVFDADARAVYRRTLGVDDATWARGRGWALFTAVMAYPYYLNRSPSIMARTRRTLAAVLSDEDA